ncbi:MAG: hypothetical protein M3305_08120 [Actinomycetota bacterium]|nr:hypothetical protein [Actinomycetota bacterium]
MTPTDENLYEPVPSDAPLDYDRVADVYDLYVTSGLDLEFYLEETDKVQGKVLELMCGTGRVSIPLLRSWSGPHLRGRLWRNASPLGRETARTEAASSSTAGGRSAP